MKQTLTALLIVIAATGCVVTEHSMLSSKSFPPLTLEDVTIYMSEDEVPGDFEKIAILNAKASAEYTRSSKMYDKIRAEAAKIGANGVLYQPVIEPGQGAKIAAAVFGTGTTRRVEMIAIYVHSK